METATFFVVVVAHFHFVDNRTVQKVDGNLSIVILLCPKQVHVLYVICCFDRSINSPLAAHSWRKNKSNTESLLYGLFLCENTINSFFHKTFGFHSKRIEQRKMCVSVYSSVATNTKWMKDNYDNCKLLTEMPPERMLASFCWSEKVCVSETTIKSRFTLSFSFIYSYFRQRRGFEQYCLSFIEPFISILSIWFYFLVANLNSIWRTPKAFIKLIPVNSIKDSILPLANWIKTKTITSL